MVVINGLEYLHSERPSKKLKVKVNGKWIHFGDSSYQHYFDKTGLLDKSLNHNDEKRRNNYLKRASKIMNDEGKYTMHDKTSPNHYAIKILW